MYQQVTLIGNLGKDPEVKATKGEPITTFSVAVNDFNKEVTWFDVVAFGKQGEVCAKYLKKGALVHVVGRFKIRKWTDDEDVNHTQYTVAVNNITFLSKKTEGAKATNKTDQPPF